MKAVQALVCLIAVVLSTASSAVALEIQVAPQTLVLSSPGGKLTVHTDVPFFQDAKTVTLLFVNGKNVALDDVFEDCQGYLVAQCTKEAVKGVIEVKEKWTNATVRLEVTPPGGDLEWDEEVITVKE